MITSSQSSPRPRAHQELELERATLAGPPCLKSKASCRRIYPACTESMVVRSSSSLMLSLLGAGFLLVPALGANFQESSGPAPGDTRGYEILQRNCFKCHGEGTKLSGL